MLTNKKDENLSPSPINSPFIINSTISKINKSTTNDLFNRTSTNDPKVSTLPNNSTESEQRGAVSRNTGLYLRLETIQKMLMKLLIKAPMTREKLACSLNISVKELNQLSAKKVPVSLIHKVNLPLIELFCKTKFNN